MTGAPLPASSPGATVALTYGWRRFRENTSGLLLAAAPLVVVQLVFGIAAYFAARTSYPLFILVMAVGFVVAMIAALGLVRASLAGAAGETIEGPMFASFERWGAWIGFATAFGVLVGMGLALCLVPGLFALAFFGLAPFYFLDGKMRVGDALNASRRATSRLDLAFPVLLAIVVGGIGAIAFGIGLFVTEPVAFIALACLYRDAVARSADVTAPE
jgi:uncharacterized membrane protein